MAQFIQARHFTKGRIKALRVVVWHDMEAPENTTTAEGVAHYFAGESAPQASAHVCADSDSVVECVKPEDTAWHAPGANSDGYGIELAGYSRQTYAQWTDAFSQATIKQAAHWVAPIMHAHGIPAHFLTDEELADGHTKGMTTHRQVTRVFKESTHTDPGEHFPEGFVVHAVQVALDSLPRPKPAAKTSHPAKPETRPTIRRGSAGADVRHAQVRLNAHGARLQADGHFGPSTEAAVKAFQKKRKLSADGVVGPATWKALDS